MEAKRITIFGAGIAGLTAAHELAERGFNVTILDQESQVGGKARSFNLKGHIHQDKEFPSEHGFRFFLRWYENLHETLKKIPLEENQGSVFEKLTEIDELLIDEHIFSFVKANPIPVRPPLAWIKAMIACTDRHETEFEETNWDEYIEANLKGNESEEVITFFKNTPKATASVHSKDASVRALSYTLNRLLLNPGLDILNGPTSVTWFIHWKNHLINNLNVNISLNSKVNKLNFNNNQLQSIEIEYADKSKHTIEADYYISAIPYERLLTLLPDQLLEQHSEFANLNKLRSGWQAGIILYLNMPIDMPRGHFGFSNSPWAISGIQSSDFWDKKHIKSSDVYQSVLSLIIADWDAMGLYIKKPAKQCTLNELVEELTYQLINYAPECYKASFAHMQIIDYTIDKGIHLTGDEKATNDTPLFMNTSGSWKNRPDSTTAIENLFLAGDFVKTSAYLATMESANESGKRAANSLLHKVNYQGEYCSIKTAKHNKSTQLTDLFSKLDKFSYDKNKKHFLDDLSTTHIEQLIDALVPYMQFEGSFIRDVDQLFSTVFGIVNSAKNNLLGGDIDLTQLLDQNEEKSTFKDDLSERIYNWAHVNMLPVEKLTKNYPDSLNSYLDLSKPIYDPLLHVAKSKGSMHRIKYAMGMNEWFKVPTEKLAHLMETGQCIHNCSLLIDDIMDNTTQRRDQQTAHMIYGVNQTLGAAYSGLFQLLLSAYLNLGEKCLLAYLEESTRAHIGQADDIYYREKQLCPTEAEYIEMVKNKTGSFFRVFTLCLSHLSDATISKDTTDKILKLADDIGVFFQIRDDYMDLVSEAYFVKKGTFASDFEEGKYSFPVVHCLQEDKTLMSLFNQYFLKTEITKADKLLLMDKLKTTGSLMYTVNIIKQMYANIMFSIQEISVLTAKENKNITEWMHDLIVDIPELGEIGNITVQKEAKLESDPFNLKEISTDTLHKALRNVIVIYNIYFKKNNWTEKDFWECFPLLLTVELIIFNVDDKNEQNHGEKTVIDRKSIEKSNFWKIISHSSFYDASMDEILDHAIEFYEMENLWYQHDQSVYDAEKVKKMNSYKSTNFQIMYLLAKNILNKPVLFDFAKVEDYSSLCIEEFEKEQDDHDHIYNVYLHFKDIFGDESENAFQQYKKQLFDKMMDDDIALATAWTHLYQKVEAKKMTEKITMPISIRKIYFKCMEIATQCINDDDLSTFALDGHINWMMNKILKVSGVSSTDNKILKRLQNDTLLSLSN